jgi:hypothetical protein
LLNLVGKNVIFTDINFVLREPVSETFDKYFTEKRQSMARVISHQNILDFLSIISKPGYFEKLEIEIIAPKIFLSKLSSLRIRQGF